MSRKSLKWLFAYPIVLIIYSLIVFILFLSGTKNHVMKLLANIDFSLVSIGAVGAIIIVLMLVLKLKNQHKKGDKYD